MKFPRAVDRGRMIADLDEKQCVNLSEMHLLFCVKMEYVSVKSMLQFDLRLLGVWGDYGRYICLIQGAMGLRNTFLLLLDKFTKNFSRIKEIGTVSSMSKTCLFKVQKSKIHFLSC